MLSTRQVSVPLAALLLLGCGLLAACSGNGGPPAREASPAPVVGQVANGEPQVGSAGSLRRAASQDARDASGDQVAPVEASHSPAQQSDPGPPLQQDDRSGESSSAADASPLYLAAEEINVNRWVLPYDYGLPKAELGTDLTVMTALTAHPLISAYHLMRVVVTVPLLTNDRPFNVTLLLDPGGAMARDEYAAAARLLASRIVAGPRPDRDRVALVRFPGGGAAPEAIAHEEPGRQAVSEAIARFRHDDQADIRAALDLAARTADDARSGRPDSHHFVVFVSDGSLELASPEPFAALGPEGDGAPLNPLRFEAYDIGLLHFEDRLLRHMGRIGNGGAFFDRTPELVGERFEARPGAGLGSRSASAPAGASPSTPRRPRGCFC